MQSVLSSWIFHAALKSWHHSRGTFSYWKLKCHPELRSLISHHAFSYWHFASLSTAVNAVTMMCTSAGLVQNQTLIFPQVCVAWQWSSYGCNIHSHNETLLSLWALAPVYTTLDSRTRFCFLPEIINETVIMVPVLSMCFQASLQTHMWFYLRFHVCEILDLLQDILFTSLFWQEVQFQREKLKKKTKVKLCRLCSSMSN